MQPRPHQLQRRNHPGETRGGFVERWSFAGLLWLSPLARHSQFGAILTESVSVR